MNIIVRLMMWIATFPLHAASLFSGDAVYWIRVIYMLSVKLSCNWIVFHGCDWCIFGSGSAAVRCHTALLMIGFLIVGIQASDISNLLFLLIFLGRSLTWIASFTLRVLKWGSRSIYFTPLQSGQCPVLIIIIVSSSAGAFFCLQWSLRPKATRARSALSARPPAAFPRLVSNLSAGKTALIMIMKVYSHDIQREIKSLLGWIVIRSLLQWRGAFNGQGVSSKWVIIEVLQRVYPCCFAVNCWTGGDRRGEIGTKSESRALLLRFPPLAWKKPEMTFIL